MVFNKFNLRNYYATMKLNTIHFIPLFLQCAGINVYMAMFLPMVILRMQRTIKPILIPIKNIK